MNEFNELYKYANSLLNLVKAYESSHDEKLIDLINEQLRKESNYLSSFAVNSLNQLLNLVLTNRNNKYDYRLGFLNNENELVLEHMKNALMSSLFFANLLLDNNFDLTPLEARHIFNHPIIGGVISDAAFLNKYMQASVNDFISDYDDISFAEYYIYLPYYYSFQDILKHEHIELDWDGKEILIIQLLDLLEESSRLVSEDINHDVNKNRFQKYCNNLSSKHGIDLAIMLNMYQIDNDEVLEVIENASFENFEGEYEINFTSNHLQEYYTYDKTKTYTTLANNLLFNSYAILDILKQIMSSSRISFSNYAAKLKEKLIIEQNLFKTLIIEEIPSFIEFLDFSYLSDFSDMDVVLNYINSGNISERSLKQISVQRIIAKLVSYTEYAFENERADYDEEDDIYVNYQNVDSSFTQQLYLYSIGKISKRELERRYEAYCGGSSLDDEEIAEYKVKKMLFLNVISELLHTNHLDVQNQVKCHKLAYLLLYANGLEDELLERYNSFNYHFSYDNLNLDVSYDDVNSQADLLISLINVINSIDLDSELLSIFIDSFSDAALGLIDPKKIERVEDRESSMDNLEVSEESQAIRDYIALKINDATFEKIMGDKGSRILQRKKND